MAHHVGRHWRSFAVARDESSGVADVLLRGTGAGNALGGTFWFELPELCADLRADPTVRCVLLRGEGAHFSVGTDLRWLLPKCRRLLRDHRADPDALAGFLAEIAELQSALSAVQSLRQPVIAAVHGRCVGSGLELAVACDIRLASRDARFRLPEVRYGIVPDLGVLQRLPRLIGESLTRDLALTGRELDADEALAHGLVTRLHDGPDEVVTGARRLAADVAGYPGHAVAAIKDVLVTGAGMTAESGLRYSALSSAAFLRAVDLPALRRDAVAEG